MYLLNLTLWQLVAVFGSVSAVAVALYLLDRSRRRQVVSTLRFWVAAEQPSAAAKRKRIRQPWSLILQLASMCLLLLAVAQLKLGTPAPAGRDHVIILDISAWMAARSGKQTLMEMARERARRYLRALPARDRVMLVRADGLATPATAFEPDRSKIEAAIDASQPGATALNLDQALAFARHAQQQAGGRAGEIAFIGTGRIGERDPNNTAAPPSRLRVLLVPDAVENAGLKKVAARRSATQPDTWEIYVSARNYGSAPRTVTLALQFGAGGASGPPAAVVASRELALPAGAEKETSFEYRTRAAGVLAVTLRPHDAFPDDDRAELELAAQPAVPVIVYSTEPELLSPVLSSLPRLKAVYRRPEEYRAGDEGLVVLDRFIPPARPRADSIWIDPPAGGSPVPVRETVENEPFGQWNAMHPAAAGLRAKDFKLEKASVFEAAPGDGWIAEVRQGPIVVARDGKPKVVVLGFHPALSEMRYELATPLLLANLLRWIAPEAFRRLEISAGSVGTVKTALEGETPANAVKVMAEDGTPLPFTLRDRVLDFFSGRPGTVRAVVNDREYVYSLTLPQLWESRWEPPANALKGLPRLSRLPDRSSDLWPWLALLGAAGLMAEWLLYGRFRRAMAAPRVRGPLLLRRRRAAATGVRR